MNLIKTGICLLFLLCSLALASESTGSTIEKSDAVVTTMTSDVKSAPDIEEENIIDRFRDWFWQSEAGAVIDRTFIVQKRYKTFWDGLCNTMMITIGALLVGVCLGVFVAICRVYYYQLGSFGFWDSLWMFCRTMRIDFLLQALIKLIDIILNAYLTIFRGTPVIVQLMIWAFVIFSTTNTIVVAIIAFGVNSGAYVSEIVRAGIMAVDRGQTEAGRSLGLTAAQTMRVIVLPQAFKNVLPALSNEFIALLKETSVVGYIAVVDITKAASLVRARTFDAFYPLLFVALFYLLMVELLTLAQHKMENIMHASDRK